MSNLLWYTLNIAHRLNDGVEVNGRKEFHVQEDMWLLEAANAEDAYRKAEANGKLIAQFGNDLLAEKPEAYQRVGLGEIKGSILHPSLVDV